MWVRNDSGARRIALVAIINNPATFVPILAKYADSGTSALTAEVKPGANENVNFDLKP